jgi:hypothetical protein
MRAFAAMTFSIVIGVLWAPLQISAQEISAAVMHEISCEDAAEKRTPIGKLVNNMWNKQAIGEQPFRQCLLFRRVGGVEEYGWSWDWPDSSKAVLAFPQVTFGWKPWNGGESTIAQLPIRIDEMGAMQLDYDLELQATGHYLLSAALWFTRTGKTSREPNPKDISADLNIWMEVSGFEPTGSKIADVTIDGANYELWHSADMSDASGTNANRWQHIVYRVSIPTRRASLDLRRFISHAVEHNLLSASHYVSSVEIGNEVMAGEGMAWVRRLNLEIR